MMNYPLIQGISIFTPPWVLGWSHVGPVSDPLSLTKLILQFVAVFVAVTWVYFKIHGTYIAQLLKGVTVIMALYLAAEIFNLTIIGGILQAVLLISIIGFIILFQPELRRLLVYLGQPDLLGKPVFNNTPRPENNVSRVIAQLCETVRLLSKSKTGALLVLESSSGLSGTYLEAGTRLDGQLSTELLLTIFHPNTPLHDGAVVLSPDYRITAAGVLLPLSENPNLSWKYGTRHRAAIGLSEVSDSQCIVVSEETGTISMVSGGNIARMASIEMLQEQLEILFGVADQNKDGSKRAMLGNVVFSDMFQRLFVKNLRSAKETNPVSAIDEPAATPQPK